MKGFIFRTIVLILETLIDELIGLILSTTTLVCVCMYVMYRRDEDDDGKEGEEGYKTTYLSFYCRKQID